MGSNRFRTDMPKYINFYLDGRLNLDEMISRRGKMEDVNEAFRAMKSRRGRSQRPDVRIVCGVAVGSNSKRTPTP